MLGFGMGRNTYGNDSENSEYNRSNSEVSGQSPIPYLFGGVAAMLALIAVALLILACSFWKLSGHSSGEGNGDGSPEKKSDEVWKESEEDAEKKVMVIMAGDAQPTFLAKPSMHDVV